MTPKRKKWLLRLALFLLLLIVGSLLFHLWKGPADLSAPAPDAESLLGETAAVFQSIRYSNELATLSFSRNEEGEWIWVDEPEFPLDGAYLDKISNAIVTLHPMQTLTADETKQGEYGLSEPSASILAETADGTQTVLLFGKALSDGSFYVKTAEETDQVYVVSKELHERISRGIYEMAKLPEFPSLTRENIQTVTFEGAQSFVLRSFDEGERWSVDSTEVTQSARLAPLLQELSTLSFAACVDYRPSAAANEICALTAPMLRLTVAYTTEAGNDAALTLTLGKKTAAGGGYFAKKDTDSSIYSIRTESVKTLLEVAAKGW